MNRNSKHTFLFSPQKKPPEPQKPPGKTVPDPLLAMYDELNAWWNKAEEDFAAMRIPHRVCHFVDSKMENNSEDATILEWNRYQNQWRILVTERTQEKPIAECPMDVRVKMASHLRSLRQKMKEAKEAYIPEVAEAIAQIKEALAD